jgi:hypothetical protein
MSDGPQGSRFAWEPKPALPAAEEAAGAARRASPDPGASPPPGAETASPPGEPEGAAPVAAAPGVQVGMAVSAGVADTWDGAETWDRAEVAEVGDVGDVGGAGDAVDLGDRDLRAAGDARDGGDDLREGKGAKPRLQPGPAAAAQLPGKKGTAERRPAERQKLGIVGGTEVGKSYLFQAMVYRTYDAGHSGALTAFLERGSISLSSGLSPARSDQSAASLTAFVNNYSLWQRLARTLRDSQRWYRLCLPYRTGVLGRGRGALEVELFDGSGEALEGGLGQNEALWEEGYLDAGVMVFCLPLWAAFPASALSPADAAKRGDLLAGFNQVVDNYRMLRQQHNRDRPVRSILALTMADDTRSALTALRERWITPYLTSPGRYLRGLRKQAGVMRYLANAQRVSALLLAELENARSPLMSGIPNRLDFNAGRPWIIPLSAVEGSVLDLLEKQSPTLAERQRLDPPVPAHVELPLLVALCARENALM